MGRSLIKTVGFDKAQYYVPLKFPEKLTGSSTYGKKTEIGRRLSRKKGIKLKFISREVNCFPLTTLKFPVPEQVGAHS